MSTHSRISRPIPDSLRFITIYGVPYYIPWEDLHQGCSFFMKTTAHARLVREELKPAAEAFGMHFRVVNRVENGYYGVRVWRF